MHAAMLAMPALALTKSNTPARLPHSPSSPRHLTYHLHHPTRPTPQHEAHTHCLAAWLAMGGFALSLAHITTHAQSHHLVTTTPTIHRTPDDSHLSYQPVHLPPPMLPLTQHSLTVQHYQTLTLTSQTRPPILTNHEAKPTSQQPNAPYHATRTHASARLGRSAAVTSQGPSW